MDAVGGGVTVGHRIADSPLFVEGRLGAAVVTQEGSEAIEAGGNGAEARAGLFLRLQAPNATSTRLRISAGIEASPTRLLHSRPLAAGLPAPPSWGIVLAIGLEGDGG